MQSFKIKIRVHYNGVNNYESIKALRLLTEFVKLGGMKKEKQDIISDERRLYDLKPMTAVLDPLARRMLGDKAFVEADIMRDWKEIVGEEWAEFSHPCGIDFKRGERKDGVLVVQVAGGGIALEMQMKQKVLIGKINTYFGYEAVSRIKIMQNAEVIKNKKQSSDNLEKKLVSKDQENYIKRQVSGIENQQLAETLEKLGCAILAESEKEQKSGKIYKKD